MKLKKLLAVPAFVATAASLAACGGGGSAALPGAAPTATPKQAQATAESSIKFSIPIGSAAAGSASVRAPQSVTQSSSKPMFVDGNTNGNATIVFDGVNVPISFNPNGTIGTGPSQSNVALPNGGSLSYTSTIGAATGTNQIVATVTANYSAIPGPHTIGVVQTNGPCVSGSYQCLASNNGYVLAEGQATISLTPGSNPNANLHLKGVMQSAFICPHTGSCTGLGTPNADGSYDLDVIVSDENGTAIPQETDGSGNVVSFDNGSYKVVETDGNGIVTISGHAGPFNAPGTDRKNTYGETINVKCAKLGTATVEAQLVPGGPSAPTVIGFNAVSGDYPAAGSYLGFTGANQYYGGPISVNCTSTGSLSVQ